MRSTRLQIAVALLSAWLLVALWGMGRAKGWW